MDTGALLDRARLTPFYQARLDVDCSFDRIVPTTRDDLLRDQLEHPPHGSRRPKSTGHPVRAGISGTGSGLLVLTFTADDLARERRVGAELLRGMGVRPGMRVANALAGALATPGALLLGDVVEEVGCLDVPIGFPSDANAARSGWAILDRVEPQIIIVDARGGATLFAAMPAADRRWLHGVIWLRVGAAGIAETLPTLALDVWQREWWAIPEATSFTAATCAAGRWHFASELISQISDHPDDPELLITPLDMETPLLRYQTGAAGRIEPQVCACGVDGAWKPGDGESEPDGFQADR